MADEWNAWFQEDFCRDTTRIEGVPLVGLPGVGDLPVGDGDGYISRSSTPGRSRSGFQRRGKMGERSVTPGRGSGLGSSACNDHRTLFGDGHDTMEAIEEETLNMSR